VHRVSMGEIIAAFADGWQVASIEPATLDITTSPCGIRAWLAAVTGYDRQARQEGPRC
jgi:hypothetical protein